MNAILEGIRVFDMSVAVVGPWTSKLLALLGADVIKVESPEGEMLNYFPPLTGGEGAQYLDANLNKRYLVSDLKRPADQETAYRLLETCDIFVQNMRVGVVDRLGFGPEEVLRRNPRLIYVSASGYGDTGPMAKQSGVDPLLQAFSGWSSLNGAEGAPGENHRYTAHLDVTTASILVESILLALIERERSGRGQEIKLSMLSSAVAAQSTRLAEYFATGRVPRPLGSADAVSAPHQAFLCRDGIWLAIGVERDEHWRRLCTALGRADLLADPRFSDNAGRVRHRAPLASLLADWLVTGVVAKWELELRRAGVPHSRVRSFDELRYHAQASDNGWFVEVDTDGGHICVGGAPWRFSRTPASEPRWLGRRDDLTAGVLAGLAAGGEAGRSAWVRQDRTSDRGARVNRSSAGILAGVTVLELAEGRCGAMAAMRLGDAGAEVIKVEPLAGDPGRQLGPPFLDDQSATFLALNRSKRSIAVDTETPEGARLVQRLARQSDVLLEDLGADRSHALGVDEGALRADSPGLIICSITGFGDAGPWSHIDGAELPAQCAAGIVNQLGRRGEEPVRLGADAATMATALFATQGVIAALLHRLRRAEGQRVEVNMVGSLLHTHSMVWAALADPDDWGGFVHETFMAPPDRGYRTADGRVYFTLRHADSEDFDTLMINLGLVEYVDDPRFADQGRAAAPTGAHQVEATEVWESGFGTRTTDEVVALILDAGGDAVPIQDLAAMIEHPQVKALDLVEEIEHPTTGGAYRDVSPVSGLTREPSAVRRRPPRLGEHTDEVLRSLGLAGGEIGWLRSKRIIR